MQEDKGPEFTWDTQALQHVSTQDSRVWPPGKGLIRHCGVHSPILSFQKYIGLLLPRPKPLGSMKASQLYGLDQTSQLVLYQTR